MYVVGGRQAIVGSGKPVVCVAKKLSLQPDSFISGASEPSVSDYARHCLGGKKTWKKR